jgi:hypothetical protein
MSSDTETSDDNVSEETNGDIIMECESEDNDDEEQNSNDLGIHPYRFEPELESENSSDVSSENPSADDSDDDEIDPNDLAAWYSVYNIFI